MRFLVAFLLVLIAGAVYLQPAFSVDEELPRDREGWDLYHKNKKIMEENEVFAKQHPAEASICFDSMMQVADKNKTITITAYFTEHQAYYRECMEHLLRAKAQEGAGQ